MSAEGSSANDSFEYTMLFMFFAIIIAIVYMMFHIYGWHFMKASFFNSISAIPEDVRRWVFFWKQDYASLAPSIADYLAEHSATFFEDTKEGVKRKSAIDSVARWLFLPYILFFITLFIIKGIRTKSGNIKRSRNAMYDYARSQSDIWVYIKHVAFVMEDIVKTTSLSEGWYAMSEIPAQWMKEKGLVVVSGKHKRDSLTQAQKKELSLNHQKTYVELRDNLGRAWAGFDDLTTHEMEIFSVIVPQLFGMTAQSRVQNRLLSLANSSDTSKEGVKQAQEARELANKNIERFKERYREYFKMPYFDDTVFEDPFDPILASFEELDSVKEMTDKAANILKKVLLGHNYVSTIMIAIYESCWMYGVLAPNEMKWIKKHDRKIWFTLSQCGRRASFVEVCGAWSHYTSEKTYGFKLLSPQVYAAMRGLDFEMWKTHENYIASIDEYDNQERWDKLVPTIETNLKG
jgi:hypothetical protein